MSVHAPLVRPTGLIPENAPFTKEQRAWLDGFFSGLLSLERGRGAQAVGAEELPAAAARAIAGECDDGAPWHDPALPLGERMSLAEARPLPRRLFAAMAQQDCGQCGYQCESYAAALAAGAEKRANLCVPGGKETSRTLKALLEQTPSLPPPVSAAVADASPAVGAASTVTPPAAAPARPGTSRDNPVAATFLSATRLNGPGAEKDTRHVVVDLAGSDLTYEPGDSIGILPRNDPALVDAVLAAMSAPPDFPVGGKTFRETLIEDYALGPAPDMLFELIGYMVGGERRRKARLLARGDDPDGDLTALDVLGALQKFGPVRPDPEALLESLEPLQPRLYSISSSPLAHAGEVHLTVDCVRYELAGRGRLGVASTFLADRLRPGDRVQVYVQKAHGFALPADGSTPIVMIGPGTGIAPFRSFLWHRRVTGARGRSWLFFGHQHEATDFFYRSELDEMLADGTLTRLATAWSRDGAEKIYVQDRMREWGPELWRWLKAGAHVYVCGDAKRMAKDVEAALVEISAKAGQMSDAGARDFLAELKATGRWQADVY